MGRREGQPDPRHRHRLGRRIIHEIHPEGYDIVGKDRGWFSRLVGRASPDVVIIGPAYTTMGAARTNDDSAILAYFAAIDELRVTTTRHS
jgi:hypothetical protein